MLFQNKNGIGHKNSERCAAVVMGINMPTTTQSEQRRPAPYPRNRVMTYAWLFHVVEVGTRWALDKARRDKVKRASYSSVAILLPIKQLNTAVSSRIYQFYPVGLSCYG